MSKHDEADLILKLYDLRREPVMRKARDWYFAEFHPDSGGDFGKALLGEHSGHLRMVVSYWNMAAGLVNHGAISSELFNDTNGEHFFVFAKLEPVLDEARSILGPDYAGNLERMIHATPDGKARLDQTRQRIKAIRAQTAAQGR